MKWSLQIAAIAGIKIYIHWSFLLLIAWVMMGSIGSGHSPEEAIYVIAFILCIFLCVTLHELGHALVAKRYNYITKDITLLPIGGMARMDEIPENPRHELIIASAGPAVNVLIALILLPIIYLSGNIPSALSLVISFKESFIVNIFIVNISLAVFNLIPAFPMDGGRMLRAFLAMRMTRVRATSIAAHTGQFIAVLFFFIGLQYNPLLAFIAVFIFLMAQAESSMVKSNNALHAYNVRDVIVHNFYEIEATKPIENAVQLLLDTPATDFLVTDSGNVIGFLDRKGIIRALSEKGYNATVADAMQRDINYVSPDMPLDKALREIQKNKSNIVPVMENEKVIGVIDVHHILDFITLKEITTNQKTI